MDIKEKSTVSQQLVNRLIKENDELKEQLNDALSLLNDQTSETKQVNDIYQKSIEQWRYYKRLYDDAIKSSNKEYKEYKNAKKEYISLTKQYRKQMNSLLKSVK